MAGDDPAALGAGRETIDATIDYTAGIDLARKTGDPVHKGDVLATLYSSNKDRLDDGEHLLLEAYDIQDEQPLPVPHFFARVTAAGVEPLA